MFSLRFRIFFYSCRVACRFWRAIIFPVHGFTNATRIPWYLSSLFSHLPEFSFIELPIVIPFCFPSLKFDTRVAFNSPSFRFILSWYPRLLFIFYFLRSPCFSRVSVFRLVIAAEEINDSKKRWTINKSEMIRYHAVVYLHSLRQHRWWAVSKSGKARQTTCFLTAGWWRGRKCAPKPNLFDRRVFSVSTCTSGNEL